MQTYSHFIITAFCSRKMQARANVAEAAGTSQKLPPLRSTALLWGSVAPDLPLILITIGALLMDLSTGSRWQPGSDADASYVGLLFREIFFHNPWVKFAHNLFHAPILIVFYAGLGYWGWMRQRRWGAPLFWFAAACGLHTALDIPVHYDDGPLLLFPFNWTLRFYSPISYWDNVRYGDQFRLFEHGLVLLLAIWLGWDWRQRRRG